MNTRVQYSGYEMVNNHNSFVHGLADDPEAHIGPAGGVKTLLPSFLKIFKQ